MSMGSDDSTKFQDKTLDRLLFFIIFIIPMTAAIITLFAVDTFMPIQTHIVLRVILDGGGFVLGGFVGFIIAIPMSTFSEWSWNAIRAQYGLKPLNEAIKQVRNREEDREESVIEARKKRFSNLDESEQRYEIFSLLKKQSEQLGELNQSLAFVRMATLAIIVMIGLLVWWL